MKKANPKIKGSIKEQLVAQYLKKRGWNILYQNKKILGVEIDLLAKKGNEHRLIEVKSIKKAEYVKGILKDKQKERLKRVAESFGDDCPHLRLFLAVVDDKSKIEFFEML